LVQASYQVLNTTNPILTEHCWLCYDIKPPFYEAVGISAKPKKQNGTNPAQCLWNIDNGNKQGITMSHVNRQGRCIG
ncbi:ENV2 protein, partial [Galbula dea]|nr:ENV2 protein [Galbula dea]